MASEWKSRGVRDTSMRSLKCFTSQSAFVLWNVLFLRIVGVLSSGMNCNLYYLGWFLFHSSYRTKCRLLTHAMVIGAIVIYVVYNPEKQLLAQLGNELPKDDGVKPDSDPSNRNERWTDFQGRLDYECRYIFRFEPPTSRNPVALSSPEAPICMRHLKILKLTDWWAYKAMNSRLSRKQYILFYHLINF